MHLKTKSKGISIFIYNTLQVDLKLIKRKISRLYGNMKLKNNDPLVVGNLIKIFQENYESKCRICKI